MTASPRTERSILAGVGRPAPGRALYFGQPNARAFGWYHAPIGKAKDCAVVLCGSIGGETTGTPRALRLWAEHLAAAGFATLRFDHHGTGDSSGASSDADRLRAWIDGISSAIDAVRENSGATRVVLAGVHFGGTLAMATVRERDDVAGLVLWAAPPTGNAFVREARAFTRLLPPNALSELAEGAEQMGGTEFSHETMASLRSFDPLAATERLEIPVLVLPREETTNDSSLVDRLAGVGATVTRVYAPGYGEMMEDAHKGIIPEAVIEASVEWLSRTFPTLSSTRAIGSATREDSQRLETSWSPGDDEASPVAEEPVRFGESGSLFGILTRSTADSLRRTGVLLVNAGAVAHVGPNRLYVSLARRWASLGYLALRMDIGGIGESRPPAGAEENHSYPAHAVSDIATGVSLLRQHGAERVVVAGLCSGAHASFHAGLELDGIDGVMLLNPIVFYWKPSDPLDPSAWLNYVESRHYKEAALQWRSWVRLFQAKVDLRYVAQVGVSRAAEVVRAKRASFTRRIFGGRNAPEHTAHDLRRIVDGGTKVLLLFSQGEPGHDFLKLNYARELRALQQTAGFDLRVLKDADHTFTAPFARSRVETELTQYLLDNHS